MVKPRLEFRRAHVDLPEDAEGEALEVVDVHCRLGDLRVDVCHLGVVCGVEAREDGVELRVDGGVFDSGSRLCSGGGLFCDALSA